jgi:hypothetical protein
MPHRDMDDHERIKATVAHFLRDCGFNKRGLKWSRRAGKIEVFFILWPSPLRGSGIKMRYRPEIRVCLLDYASDQLRLDHKIWDPFCQISFSVSSIYSDEDKSRSFDALYNLNFSMPIEKRIKKIEYLFRYTLVPIISAMFSIEGILNLFANGILPNYAFNEYFVNISGMRAIFEQNSAAKKIYDDRVAYVARLNAERQ